MGLEQALVDFFTNIGLLHLTVGNVIMILVGFTLIYLAIKYEMEPLLLLPIGISAVLVNLPLTGILSADPHHPGLFY
ncbi:glutaconyl-CoA decarboxylase subunit beta, partial [Thermococci archaeon]